MAPVLTGSPTNPRVRRVLAAAALAGVDVKLNEVSMSDFKTEEFVKKNPLQYLPWLEDGDLQIAESAAIAEYVAELGPNQTLVPSDPEDRARVRQWTAYGDQSVFARISVANYMNLNRIPYTKPAYTAVVDILVDQLIHLNTVLLDRTFLVGERISIADVIVASAAAYALSGHVHVGLHDKIPNVVRYVNTYVNHPKLASIYSDYKFAESAPTYTPPQKEQKAKAPKAETPAAAPKPKAEKKPKVQEDDDDDEPLVPEEPKAKNPLDDLPKSAFNLEEWKRQYSNLDTRKGALPWFYEKFDKDGFSIWRCNFKYNEELTQVFMSSNQIGGFFNRLEASRKYLFGSVLVLGKANDSVISGVLICRGQDIKPVVEVAPDWESYDFKEIKLDNEEDKKFFEGALAWDLEIDSKQSADGKVFK